MLHLLLALAVESHAVAVRPEAQPGCPAARAVEAALASRLGRALVPFERAAERDALVLGLDTDDLGATTLSITDRHGRERLHRTMEPPSGGKDCEALAETAALIVERFLVELNYRPPPPPPPPAAPPPPARRWELSVASSWRPGSEGWGAFELGGRLGRSFRHNRVLVALVAGMGGSSNPVPSGSRYQGQARQRKFPLELGLWWSTAPAFAELQLGAGGALDITRTTAQGDEQETQTLPGPAAWAAAAVRAPLGPRLFARVASAVVGSIIKYDFSYRAGTDDMVTVFSAPPRRFYARITADVGVTLP